MSIATNIKEIQASIAAIAKACGRDLQDIQLVAVSKRFPASAIEEAMKAGQLVFGENYIQEAEEKIEQISTSARIHFIGHLQSNKAKTAARIFDVIETVDSVKLAKNLSKHLQKYNRCMEILIQVNIGNDDNKSGVSANATEQLIRDIHKLPGLQVVGLMTMPPFTEDPELARPHFRELKTLADSLSAKGLFSSDRKVELSMGMSNDYHVAIQEGATIIRIGTAIFGER